MAMKNPFTSTPGNSHNHKAMSKFRINMSPTTGKPIGDIGKKGMGSGKAPDLSARPVHGQKVK